MSFDSGKTKTLDFKCVGDFEFTQKINNITDTTFAYISNVSSDIQQQMTDNKNDIDTINDTTIPGLQSQIDSNDTDITSLDARIVVNEGKLSPVAYTDNSFSILPVITTSTNNFVIPFSIKPEIDITSDDTNYIYGYVQLI